MNILIESSKSFQEVVFDFEPSAQRLGLTVLARHDLGEALVRRTDAAQTLPDAEHASWVAAQQRNVEKLGDEIAAAVMAAQN